RTGAVRVVARRVDVGAVASRERDVEQAVPAAHAPAWVIAQRNMCVLLRSTWLLCDVRADPTLADTAILRAAVSACPGARRRARATVATAVGRARAIAIAAAS